MSRPVDPRRFDDLVRHQLEHAAHDQDADDQLQRDVRQNEAARVVDQAEPMLGFVDADDRDDPHREIERNEQHRHDDARAARADMHERVTGEHGAERGDQHRGRRDIDAVEQVHRQRGDALENIGIVREVEALRPEIAAHRVGKRLHRHQQHPGERQQDDEVEQVDHHVADDRARVAGGGALRSPRVDVAVIGFERHRRIIPSAGKFATAAAITHIIASAPIMPMAAA